jgi:hypothetical protein
MTLNRRLFEMGLDDIPGLELYCCSSPTPRSVLSKRGWWHFHSTHQDPRQPAHLAPCRDRHPMGQESAATFPYSKPSCLAQVAGCRSLDRIEASLRPLAGLDRCEPAATIRAGRPAGCSRYITADNPPVRGGTPDSSCRTRVRSQIRCGRRWGGERGGFARVPANTGAVIPRVTLVPAAAPPGTSRFRPSRLG